MGLLELVTGNCNGTLPKEAKQQWGMTTVVG